MTSDLFLLEGPDGGGKTTLARELAARLDAHLVHCGPLPHLGEDQLARWYAELMGPALRSDRAVVMDRSWLSEHVYGAVHRAGADRLGNVRRRLLDRLALRCAARVVLCLPRLEVCLTTFRGRRRQEMLTGEDQLRQVHAAYNLGLLRERTALPVTRYDRERRTSAEVVERLAERSPGHTHTAPSGGHLRAPVVLVGEAFAEPCGHDPTYRVPFLSFGRGGCSWWLAEQLEAAGIREDRLLWLNADFPHRAAEELILGAQRRAVFALGEVAARFLRDIGIRDATEVEHPQHHKRFRFKEPYPLIRYLKEVLR